MARSKQSSDKPKVQDLLDRLAAEEQAFLSREFLAPAVAGGSVAVRIGGVICKLTMEPGDLVGWGIFQPLSHVRARFVRAATLAERQRYLRLFPTIRLILCRRAGDVWSGSAASFGDGRIQLDGMAPVLLAQEVQLFDQVCTRFDGSAFWFDELDPRHDPACAPFLRSALAERRPPEQLKRKGLSAEERAAYELNYWELQRFGAGNETAQRPPPGSARRPGRRLPLAAGKGDPVAGRLRDSLSHAGATLVDYLERGDSFRVTYLVGTQRYTSSVTKQDLSVQVAGVCLSGEDRKFDLASLVGVLREGEQGHQILEVGDDEASIDEEHYWRVHPPRDR